jgi:hypothetical protein
MVLDLLWHVVRCIVDLEANNAQAAEVVDEDGGARVAPLGEFAFQLSE